MLTSESVPSLIAEHELPKQTLHRWKAQAQVDAGLADGFTSTASQARPDAHRHTKKLERESILKERDREVF